MFSEEILKKKFINYFFNIVETKLNSVQCRSKHV